MRVLTCGVAVVASAFAIGACAVPEPVEPRFVVSDSAGVPWVRSAFPVHETVVVDPNPRFVVGDDFGAPDYVLFGARYAAHLSDGRIVIGNRGSRELFFFSPEGDFEGVFGRQGDGPGEFQRLFDLYRCDDDQLVVEELSRITVLDGRLREFDRNVQIAGHLARTRADLAGVDASCSAALMVDSDDVSLIATPEIFDFPVTLYWADLATAERDTLATVGATQAFGWEFQGQPLPVRLPYGRVASWATHPDGVVLGLADSKTFRVVNRAGGVTRVVEWSGPLQEVTDDEWAHYEESVEAFRRDFPEESRYQPAPGYLPRPASKPAYSRLLVDDLGRVWVQAYGLYEADGPTSSVTWWLFGPDGEWLAEVLAPEGLEVLAIGSSTIIGVTTDEFDLEQVQVHGYDVPHRPPS